MNVFKKIIFVLIFIICITNSCNREQDIKNENISNINHEWYSLNYKNLNKYLNDIYKNNIHYKDNENDIFEFMGYVSDTILENNFIIYSDDIVLYIYIKDNKDNVLSVYSYILINENKYRENIFELKNIDKFIYIINEYFLITDNKINIDVIK